MMCSARIVPWLVAGLTALAACGVAGEPSLTAAEYLQNRPAGQRKEMAGLEAEWARLGGVLRDDLGAPSAAELERVRPAAVRALADAAFPQVRAYYEARLEYGRSTMPAEGLYYLGNAQAERDLVGFFRGISEPPSRRGPPVRALGPELDALETELLAAYRPPASIDRHREFIEVSSTLKEARELEAAGLYHGALLRYLQVVLRFAPLRPLQPAGSDLMELESRLSEGGVEHSLGRLFLETAQAEPELAPTIAGEEEGEVLVPGAARERPMAAGEAHVYRMEVTEKPVLVTVEQRSVDVVMEVQGPADREPFTIEAGNRRWGPEVLLLNGVGDYRIEVRPRERSVWPGRYVIQAAAAPEEVDALAAMSRAGQLVFEGTPEAQRRAVSTYREALAVWRSLGELRWEAEVLTTIAGLEQDLSELRPAIQGYLEALALWRELGEPRREAAVLNRLGLTYLRVGETDRSRHSLQEALALWQSLGEPCDEGETRGNLCLVEHDSGSLPAALACYEETRAHFRELGVQSQEALLLNNIGGVYDLLGEPDAALSFYEQALPLRRASGDRSGEVQTLNNIAVIHRALGEWQEALRVYGEMREIVAALGDRRWEATLLNNVGYTYISLGEPQRALAFLEDALRLRREMGEGRNEVITLNNLGLAWLGLGDLEKALDHHRRALERAFALSDPRQEAISRVRLGEVYLERNDPSAALREIEPALAQMRETGNRRGETQILHMRGRALTLAGQPREGLPLLREALERNRALRDPAGEAETLHALAVTERHLGLLDDARAHAEAAVARVEELRAGFVTPELRAAFLAARRRAYTLVIDLLMDRHAADPRSGHDRAALAVSEQARARSLLDVLRSGTARPGTAVPAGLLDRRKSLRRRLSAKINQQVKQSGARAAALEKEIEALLAELDSVEAEIRRHDPRYAAFSEPQPIDFQGIAGLLDPGTLLLEYSLGEERSFLWAVRDGDLRTFILPSQREIETLVRQVHEELGTVESGAGLQSDAAEALGRILLGPVWREAAHFRRLVVVPDGALHYLPFAGLQVPDPGQGWETAGARRDLVEHQEVDYLPSATILALQRQRLERRSPAPKWAAVLADPVFSPDDPRLRKPGLAGRVASNPLRGGEAGGLLPLFQRLSSSRKEAEVIASLAPAGQVWAAFDLAANREAVLSGDLRSYRVIHFATHGIADARNPELSGLVLSLVDAAGRPREGFLGLTDIYELDLAADLVVLSGCRTALGKEVRGEGIMGLTRGFLYAGAPRVVASLWPVQDRTTAELMGRFYRALWTDGLSPAAALRKAQQSLREERRYRDPYYWAGFVLQGDWR